MTEKPLVRLRIGAYGRISLDAEGEALGVARQHEDCRQLADRRGWEIARTYTDNGISAYKRGVVRPDFERLLADLESGALDGLVAYDLDRLARRPKDLERIIDIYETRPHLLFATVQGEIDLSTSNGRAMARVLVTMANKASEDTSRRGKRKELERAQRGLPKKGPRPFGYAANQMDLDPVEAPIVQEMGRKFLAGASYAEIATDLNERGITMRSGERWRAESVQRLLSLLRYGGLREYRGEIYKGKWTPIFEADEWDMIQREVKRRRERFGERPVYRKHVLSGMLKCGKCGGFLTGMTKRDRPGEPLRYVYGCPSSSAVYRRPGCGGITVAAPPLEHFIREAIVFRLDSTDLARLLADGADDKDRVRELLAENDQLQERLNALVDDYADGTLTKAAYTRATSRLEARVAEIDREIDRLRQQQFKLSLKAGETVRDAWNSRGLGWQRSLMAVLINEVIVNGSRKRPIYDMDGQGVLFDMNRVVIDWKA